ncbi:MAG: hypothetical protein ABIO70_01435 [Pseudomonadota bacterium]
MRFRPTLAALLLTGCSLSPEKFAHKVSGEWCGWKHGCGELDATQAEMCQGIEEETWIGWLDEESCGYARDRSRRLYRDFARDLRAADCDRLDGYALLAALRDDVCDQPHSPLDTCDGCREETGGGTGL